MTFRRLSKHANGETIADNWGRAPFHGAPAVRQRHPRMQNPLLFLLPPRPLRKVVVQVADVDLKDEDPIAVKDVLVDVGMATLSDVAMHREAVLAAVLRQTKGCAGVSAPAPLV